MLRKPFKIAKKTSALKSREWIRSTFGITDLMIPKLDKDCKDWNMRMSLYVNFCDIILFILDDGLQQVSCSCCQPMDLVDLVVPLICQDGHIIHHTVRWATVRYICILPVGLVDLVCSPYVRMDTSSPQSQVSCSWWFFSSVRMDTPFTTESGELQLLPAGEVGRPGGSPQLSWWTHRSPQSHVSCSWFQLVNLVDLVVLLVCPDIQTVYYRFRWAASSASWSIW